MEEVIKERLEVCVYVCVCVCVCVCILLSFSSSLRLLASWSLLVHCLACMSETHLFSFLFSSSVSFSRFSDDRSRHRATATCLGAWSRPRRPPSWFVSSSHSRSSSRRGSSGSRGGRGRAEAVFVVLSRQLPSKNAIAVFHVVTLVLFVWPLLPLLPLL
jgi:hypothetical protein